MRKLINLRDYQKECIKEIEGLDNGAYLISLATALGKTAIFTQIESNGRILILSHRKELVEQPLDYYNCKCGIEMGKYHSNGEKVVSASVQSIARRLDSFKPDDFDIIITDEAHHATAASYRKIYEYFRPRLHLGFTATPYRTDRDNLNKIYSRIIFERSLRWGIENDYLCNIRCLQIDIDYNISEVGATKEDFKIKELSDAIDKEILNESIAKAYKNYAKGQTIIFATTIQHAKNIAAKIADAAVVSEKTSDNERDRINKDFRSGKIKCIVNCMIYTEGTDFPMIETVILARPTKSAVLYSQMVGRGLRKWDKKPKKVLNLIDCVGNAGNHNICGPHTLFGIDNIPKYIPRERFNGKKITEFDETIREEITKFIDIKINATAFNVFLTSNNCDTKNIDFIYLPNGGMMCTPNVYEKIYISPPDSNGCSSAYTLSKHRNTLMYESKPLQETIDFVYNYLNNNCKPSFWDLNVIPNWGDQSATEPQLAKIEQLLKEKGITYNRIDDLTKYEASRMITKLSIE